MGAHININYLFQVRSCTFASEYFGNLRSLMDPQIWLSHGMGHHILLKKSLRPCSRFAYLFCSFFTSQQKALLPSIVFKIFLIDTVILYKILYLILVSSLLIGDLFIFFLLQQWIEKAPNENLHLPKPNVFIPTDLTIKLVQEKVTTSQPELY